jgi:programmed cell death 6-interacting protein
MLALPLQRGENVDLATAFYSFLQKEYGEAGVGSLSADVPAFQQLRDNALCVSDTNEAGTVNIQRYHYHLGFIAPRLREYDSNDLKFSFVWYDGFRNSRKITTTSLYVDWACLLWNFGAIESQRGAKIDRSTEEGVRNASKHFQQAAGIFEYIRKTLTKDFQGPVPAGLTDEGLHMSTQLMLAQAQLCFYEKARNVYP